MESLRKLGILGDPGAVSRVDKMFVVQVYCKIARRDLTVNFHHEHFIDPTNCPWVSEDGNWVILIFSGQKPCIKIT